MGETQHFGLTTVGADGRISDYGHKYTLRDRETIDSLLYSLFMHDHSSEGMEFIGSPNQAPELTVERHENGLLPANMDLYYSVTFVDRYGNETAASTTAFARTPGVYADPLPATNMTVADSGGTLESGTYRYSFAWNTDDGTTRATTVAQANIGFGVTTGQITMTLPTAPDGVSGITVYRRAPGETDFYELHSMAVPLSATWTDDGSYAPNCAKTRPVYNTTNSSNRVLVSLGPADIPVPDGIVAWRIYRTSTPGYSARSLLAEVVETEFETGGPLVTEFWDYGASTMTGQPPMRSSIPPTPPKLNPALSFDVGSGLRIPAAVAPSGVSTHTTFMPGTLVDKTYNMFVANKDMSVDRMDLFFPAAPTVGVGESITVTVKDDYSANEVQAVWTDSQAEDAIMEFWIQRSTSAAPSGTFTITLRYPLFDNEFTTDPIPWDATSLQVQEALEESPHINSVIVSGDGTQSSPWAVVMVDPGETALPVYPWIYGEGSLVGGYVSSNTNVVGSDGGTFKLSYDGDDTGELAFDISAGDLELALEGLDGITDVDVTGAGTVDDPWIVEFIDPPAIDVSSFIPDSNTLNGSAYVEELVAGSGPTSFSLVVDDTDQLWSWEAFPEVHVVEEAEDMTLSGTASVVSDGFAGNQYAVTLFQGDSVSWDIGVLHPGKYSFECFVRQVTDSHAFSSADIELYDNNTSTVLASYTIPYGRRNVYDPNIEFRVVLDGTEDLSFRVVCVEEESEFDGSFNVDKMNYTYNRPVLHEGSTVTVEVDVEGSAVGADASLTVWH